MIVTNYPPNISQVWVPRIRKERPTKDRLRILKGHLKAILAESPRPMCASVQVAPGVRRRAGAK